MAKGLDARKPIDFQSFQKTVRAVEKFWFGVVKLPQEPSGAEKSARAH